MSIQSCLLHIFNGLHGYASFHNEMTINSASSDTLTSFKAALTEENPETDYPLIDEVQALKN